MSKSAAGLSATRSSLSRCAQAIWRAAIAAQVLLASGILALCLCASEVRSEDSAPPEAPAAIVVVSVLSDSSIATGRGNEFRLRRPDGSAVRVQLDQVVIALVEAFPDLVLLDLVPDPAAPVARPARVSCVVGGLAPGIDFFLHSNGTAGAPQRSAEDGSLSFEIDLAQRGVFCVSANRGTLFLDHDLNLGGGDLLESIVATADGITIDGQGGRLLAGGAPIAILVQGRRNVTIRNFASIEGAVAGVFLSAANDCLVENVVFRGLTQAAGAVDGRGNVIRRCTVLGRGAEFSQGLLLNSQVEVMEATLEANAVSDATEACIVVDAAGQGLPGGVSNNRILGNHFRRNGLGLNLLFAGPLVAENRFEENGIGLIFPFGAGGRVFHNDFSGNDTHFGGPFAAVVTAWDAGFEGGGGNFWGGYVDVDVFTGPTQTDPGGPDGFWDHPFVVHEATGQVDRFPLTAPFYNNPPTIDPPIAALRMDEDGEVTYDLTPHGKDAETVATALVWSVAIADNVAGSGSPAPPVGSATIDPATRVLTVRGAASGFGDAGLRVRVTDARGAFAEQVFAVNVDPVNDRPGLLVDSAAVVTIVEGELVSIPAAGRDVADPGDTITLTTGALPPGATFAAVAGNPALGEFRWRPEPGQAGEYAITFSADDSGFPPLSASRIVTIVVRPLNQTPAFTRVAPPGVAGIVTEMRIREGEVLALEVEASDPDTGQFVALSAGTLAPTPGFPALPARALFAATAGNPASGTLLFQPDFGDAGEYDFLILAVDDHVSPKMDGAVVHVVVENVNRTPGSAVLAPNGGERLSGADALAKWTGADPDGDPLLVRLWIEQAAGSAGAPPLAGEVLLDEGLPAVGELRFDTRALPDGAGYRLRAEAADDGSGGIPGSGGVPLSGVDRSDGPFLVDNTAPVGRLDVPAGGYLYLESLLLAGEAIDPPFFPASGSVAPSALPLVVRLSLDPGTPAARVLALGDTLALDTLAFGDHLLRLEVEDQVAHRTVLDRAFRILSLEAGFEDIVTRLQALIADPATPAAALPILQDALDLLIGNNGGRANNGALDKLREGNLVAGFEKLFQAARKLELAIPLEPDAQPLAEGLALLTRDIIRVRLAHLEATLGAGHPDVVRVRGYYDAGVAALAGGRYADAIREFKQAQQRIQGLDADPPTIVKLSPVRYLPVGDVRLHYQYSDFLTDVDPDSVVVLVDGVDRTGSATIRDDKEIVLDLVLAEGDHEVRVRVADVRGNLAERVDFVGVDLTDPVAEFESPAEGAYVNSDRPMVVVAYSDPLGNGFASGIDLDAVRLFEDGRDVTAEAALGATGAVVQAPPEQSLADGEHEYRGSFADRAGRMVERVRRFTVDTVRPFVAIESPADGSTIATILVEFRVFATDLHGVALASAKLNDHEMADRFTRDGDFFVYRPRTGDPVFLLLGENLLVVEVVDGAANVARAESRFVLSGTEAPPAFVPPKLRIDVIGGDGQFGPMGRCLEGALTASPNLPGIFRAGAGEILLVEAHDENAGDEVIAGGVTIWEPEAAGGFVVEAPGFSTVTDASGRAAVRYILAPTPGPQRIKVSLGGMVGSAYFTETAETPLFGAGSVSTTAIAEALVGSGELSMAATLVRMHEGVPVAIPHSAIALEISVDGAAAVPDSDVYLSPLSGQTDEDGLVIWCVVPLRAGAWSMTAKSSEFPDLPAVSFFKPVVGRVARVVDDPDARTPSIVTADGATSDNGKVATADHPIRVTIQPEKLLGAAPGLAEPLVSGWFISIHDTCKPPGHPCTSIRDAGLPGSSGGSIFTKTVGKREKLILEFTPISQPTPRAIGMNVARVSPDGSVSGVVHSELLVYAGAEARVVRLDSSGVFVTASAVLLARTESSASTATKYHVEARLPVGGGSGKTALIVGLDECGAEFVPLVGAQPPVKRRIEVPVAAEQPAPERFELLRSAFFTTVSGQTTERAITGLPEPDRDPEAPPGDPILLESVATGTRSVRGSNQGFVSIRMAFSKESEHLRAKGLEPLAIVDPDVAEGAVEWPPTPWSKVIQRPARLMIRMLRETSSPPAQLTIEASTSRSGSSTISLILNKERKEIQPGIWEYRGVFPELALINQGLFVKDIADDLGEFAIYDFAADDASSFADGREFRKRAIDLGFTEERGHVEALRSDGNIVSISKADQPQSPVVDPAPPNDLFVASAGVEHLFLKYAEGSGGYLYDPLPWKVRNQADIFYYSGHGVHNAAAFTFDAKGKSPLMLVVALTGEWSKDLDLAVISGCSVADIGNFNGRSDFRGFPGQELARSGCKLILGYNDGSPADNHFGVKDFTATIIAEFMVRYGDLRAAGDGDAIIRAWINSNIATETTLHDPGEVSEKHGGYHSCGIDTSHPDPANHFYLYYDKREGHHRIEKVIRADWPIPP